ncbi:MAG: FG-GAP-like repeat-containing protein [Planctomycetaceae bacterium]|nr:FG-GAP-like repeat-containing protein [Planctomycetaceae bacterium]
MEPAAEHPNLSSPGRRPGVGFRARDHWIGFLVLIGVGLGGWWWSQPGVEELLESASAAMTRGEFEVAQRLASRAGRRAPRQTRGWLLAGRAAERQRDYEGALRFYDRIPVDQPLPAGAADGHAAAAALLLQFLHRADAAESRYRQALAVDPEHAVAGRGLAVLLGISGRRREAVPWILKRVEAGDVTVDELNMLDAGGGARYETDLMQLCHQQHPDDPVPLLGLAVEALRTHRFDEAITLSRKALEVRDDLPVAEAVLGRALLEADRIAELPAWHRGLSDAADADPEVWAIRGEFHGRPGSGRAAARCYWEALRIDPDHRAANYRLAELLQHLGRTEMAEAFRLRTRQLQELKSLNDQLAGGGEHGPVVLVHRKVLLLRRMGRAWEAWGWVRATARRQNPPAWVDDLQRELAEVVNRQQSALLTLPAENPAGRIDLAGLPRGAWPDVSVAVDPPPIAAKEVLASFRDDAATAGVTMQYVNGGDPARPGQQMFEFTGGGVAVLDFDRDGWPDLYFTQGTDWPVDRGSTEHVDRLYRNRGDGRFEDVTRLAGLSATGFGQGVAVGDLDGDGWPDLHVGNIGANQVFRNNGDGTFSDVTDVVGVAGDRWTTSSTIADINADGVADLYVVNYLSGSDVFTRLCRHPDGRARMCQPFQFSAAADRIYQGRGDGTFDDVTRGAGVVAAGGKGLGLVVADLGGESGRLGVFVANDTRANFLYRHAVDSSAGSMLLDENGLAAGAGLNGNGRAEGSMGVAAGDADGDGRLDLFVTNFLDESNTFYAGLGQGRFNDMTRQAGLAVSSRSTLGFGTQFLDADLDGDLDLIVTNGHVDDYTREGRPYRMAAQYYRNRGDGRFDLGAAEDLGPHFSERYLGRGLARVDWNRDGRPDAVITAVDVPAVLLTNTTRRCGHWLVLRLVGTTTHRDAIGTRVIVRAGGKTWFHQLTAGDGYHASNDRRLLLGLGEHERIEGLEVKWPRGRPQKFSNVQLDRELVVIEGRGLFDLPFDRP